jgi:hypothetical protein
MAKAKKTETKTESAPKKAPAATKKAVAEKEHAAKATAAPKPAVKKTAAKPAPAPASPLFDTSLAAQDAARMLTAGLKKPATASSAPKPQESAMFKQLKAGLNKPHSATMSNLLEKSQGPEPTKTHPQQKQVGQNQTFSADVTRSGVPRRTPG